MQIDVPKEIKNHEYRVGLSPASIRELSRHGHQVSIKTNVRLGIDMEDKDYEEVGGDNC